MSAFQNWLYHVFLTWKWVVPFMTSKWGWPISETVHFLGLSLLMGTIGMFDLRLLGLGKRVPIAALHKLVPWGISGYVMALLTGLLFLGTEPDQYLFNSAFHWKVLFMTCAGVNVAMFYLVFFRRVKLLGSGQDAQWQAKLIGALSLFLWIGVIVFGRMLTFYRPALCGSDPVAFVSTCIPPR